MALSAMKNMVLNSVSLNDHDALAYDPFLLQDGTVGRASHFEIVYLTDDETRVRYGFDYDAKRIVNE